MPLPSSSASGRNARRPCDEANAAQVSATKERGDCGVEVVESVDDLGAVKLELVLSPRAEALEALDHESSPALGHIDEIQRFEARPNKLVLVVRQRRYMVAEDVIGETSTFRCAERTPKRRNPPRTFPPLASRIRSNDYREPTGPECGER